MARATRATPRAGSCVRVRPSVLGQVRLLADRNGGLVRLLGLEIGEPGEQGIKCQRYAAVIEDGVLLKLVGALAWQHRGTVHTRTRGHSPSRGIPHVHAGGTRGTWAGPRRGVRGEAWSRRCRLATAVCARGRRSLHGPTSSVCAAAPVQRVESKPAELKVSDCRSMIELWKAIYPDSCK